MPYWFERIIRKKEIQQNSVYVGDIHNTAGHNRLLICLLRGLLVFMASYGTIIGVLDAFSLPFNRPAIIGFLFVISMLVALLYLHKVLFYAGYFIILAVFTRQLIYYYLYANSGYQAIMNVIYEKYSDYFKLLTLREAEEIYTSRYETITIAAFFIGTFLALLLNVTISGYMNTIETILITFPLLEIALYIEEKPPLHCIILLLSVYLSVAIQQYSKNFRMQVKGKHTKEFIRIKKKNRHNFNYQGNAKGIFFTILLSLAIVVSLGLCASPLYHADKKPSKPNAIRAEMDNLIKIYIQNGISGLFDRYDTKGGVSSTGKLGGVSSVRPDFQTDLIVTFAPYSYDTIYLKSFTGSQYHQNQWLSHSYNDIASEYPSVHLTEKNILTYDNLYIPKTEAQGKMQIQNVDLFPGTILVPYYSEQPETSFPVNDTMTFEYNPYIAFSYDSTEVTLPHEYDTYIHEKCLEVPSELYPSLYQYCQEAGLGETLEGMEIGEIPDHVPPEDANDYINEQRRRLAYEVYSHFIKEYDYTMSPGSTPFNQDFVEYFLTRQKRGFCVHFASSAVLLLRTMGVPARYVEGYCIPATLVSEGKAVPAQTLSDWYEGPSVLDEQGVIEVSVNDSYAHAWVEIYMEGYGFVPFEVTPADMDNEMGIPDLGGLFAGLFDINFNMADLPDANPNDTFTQPQEALFRFFPGKAASEILLPFSLFVGGLLLVVCIIYGYQTFKLTKRRNKWKKEGNYGALIHEDYMEITSMFYRRLQHSKILKNEIDITSPNLLPDDLCKLLNSVSTILSGKKKSISIQTERFEMFRLYALNALYSEKGITAEDYEDYLKCYKEIIHLCKLIK